MGLLVSVYKSPLGDATRSGMSSGVTRLCVVNMAGPFEPGNNSPPALLEKHVPGCLRIVPAYHTEDGWKRIPFHWMMGGNFAHTSDSRFSEACETLLGHRFYAAVAIHDRLE